MLDAQSEFVWKETILGHFERQIDEVERFYNALARTYDGSGRKFFAITGHVSMMLDLGLFSTPDDASKRLEKALRNAWVKIRYGHPTIASWVEVDEKDGTCRKIYETPSEAPGMLSLEKWLSTTFQAVSNGMTGAEWCNSDPPVPRLPTLFLITPPPDAQMKGKLCRDLVLRSNHDIIDGIGTLHLFNNIFRHAVEEITQDSPTIPEFGSESMNLSPSFRLASGVPAILTPELQKRFEEINIHNAALREHCEILSIPFKRGALLPGKHQRVAMTLSDSDTNQLLLACKSVGSTVTHAYHAAIAITMRDMVQRGEKEKIVRYFSYCLVNERDKCVEPYNSPKHPVSVYHSVSGKSLVLDLKVSAAIESEEDHVTALRKVEFKHALDEVRDFYCAVRNDQEHLPMIPTYWARGTLQIPLNASAHLPVPPPNSSPSVSISSMGLVDRIIEPSQGPFELDDPWVTAEELGSGLGVFLGTFKGRLSLSAAYNEAWHDRTEVTGFLEACNLVVMQSMDIQ